MPKVNYGKTALKGAKAYKMRTDILQGELTKVQRKEIQRVFHAANRRIENIEKSGVYSPAYQSLKATFDDRANLTKFAKFSLSGMSEAEIKIEYAKAISFLAKPTSTASGAKTFEKHVKNELGLNDWQFQTAKDRLLNKNLDEKQRTFAETYLMKYKEVYQQFERAVNDVSEQIENDAQKVVNEIDRAENEVYKIDKVLGDVMDAFKRFGM